MRGGEGGEGRSGGEQGRRGGERRGKGGEVEGSEEICKWKERRGEGMRKRKMRIYGATKERWKGVQENISFVLLLYACTCPVISSGLPHNKDG